MQSVSPGCTSTEIAATNGLKLDDEIATILKDMPTVLAEDIMDGVLYVLSTPPHVQVHELIIKPVNEKF